jgi:hypothetical protein
MDNWSLGVRNNMLRNQQLDWCLHAGHHCSAGCWYNLQQKVSCKHNPCFCCCSCVMLTTLTPPPKDTVVSGASVKDRVAFTSAHTKSTYACILSCAPASNRVRYIHNTRSK